MSNTETELDIFISHSGRDEKIASLLIDLLRAAMNIPPERIRCTSVDGYRLPGGAATDDQLKREVRVAKCFIALLTPQSIKSTYVLFELGARWGAMLPFIPLLAAGLNALDLEGPVSGLNALSCSSNSQLHQLVSDIRRIIGGTRNDPSAYEAKLQALRSLSDELAALVEPASKPKEPPSPLKKKEELSDDAKEILDLILQEPEEDQRGLVIIREELQPGQIHFFPKLQYGGAAQPCHARAMRKALTELVGAGWLHPPEENPSTNTVTFEFKGQKGE